jgi:outer membrane receptor protein involved in Fe transport
VNNYAGYIQNGIDFFSGHLRIETGLRFDYFTYDVNGFELGENENLLLGKESAGKFQPKIAVVWSPFEKLPVSLYANYGRGISSQDARGVVRNPPAPKISTTDFYQLGTSYNSQKVSAVFSAFLIDRSNEQVYIPDDGSIEFAGRSRSYGAEARGSIKFNRNLSFNGGLTQVIEAFYPGEFTAANRRVIVDSAPKTVANGSFVLSELRGFNASLNWRHISSYRLDGEDESLRASGHDVVDFSLSKRLRKWVDLNFSIDNLFNKRYYETQNYFESRLLTDAPVGVAPDTGRNIYPSRIHATPGYPFTVNAGLTFRFGAKN